jgi:hypothetical protein
MYPPIADFEPLLDEPDPVSATVQEARRMLHHEMPATELQKEWEYLPASLVSLVLQVDVFGRRFDCSQALVRAIRHYRREIVSAAPWKVGRAKPLPIKPIRYLRAALAGGSDRLRRLELPLGA